MPAGDIGGALALDTAFGSSCWLALLTGTRTRFMGDCISAADK
jgi:hypothetical protein